MADRFEAKWPVAVLSAVEIANGRSYLSAVEVANLYDMAYSTFMKRLKDYVQHGKYPVTAFQVGRVLGSGSRGHWRIGIHPVLGIRALNRHFYPGLNVK
jgi:hypothetical protein